MAQPSEYLRLSQLDLWTPVISDIVGHLPIAPHITFLTHHEPCRVSSRGSIGVGAVKITPMLPTSDAGLTKI